MATAIQFLRSKEPSLRPVPAELSDGMPMVNLHESEPGLFFATTDGELTKVGPTHVGPNAPNSTPALTPGNCAGEQWLDTTDPKFPVLKVWDGEDWIIAGPSLANIDADGIIVLGPDGNLISYPDFTYDGTTNTLKSLGNAQFGSGCSNSFKVDATSEFSCSLTLTNDLFVTGNSQFTGQLDVTGPTSVTGNLAVTGSSLYTGPVTVDGNVVLGSPGSSCSQLLTVNSLSTFNCDVTINSNLTVVGDTNLTGKLDVVGDTTITGDTIIGGADNSLTVLGDTELKKDLVIGGDLSVTGDLDFGSDLELAGDLTAEGDIVLGKSGQCATHTVKIYNKVQSDCDVEVGTIGSATVVIGKTGNITLDGTLTAETSVSVGTGDEVVLDGATGNVSADGTITAAYFVGDGSQITNLNIPGSMTFQGSIDATSDPAPSANTGDFYINTGTGNVAASYTGVAGDPIAQDQFIYYTIDNEWVISATTAGYVTLDGAQTISGSKTFTADQSFNENVSIAKNLTVSKNTTLGNASTDALTVGATSTFSAPVAVNGTLGVTGASTLDSVGVTNNATVGGTLGVSGASTLDSVGVTNNATVGGTLGVTGASTLDSVGVTNNATVGGTLVVTGLATCSTATTAASPADTLVTKGFLNGLFPDFSDGDGDTLDTRYVKMVGDNMTGSLTLGTNKIILDIAGNGTFSGTLDVASAATLGSVAVTTSATVGTTLDVTGATTLTTLTTSGAATLDSVGVTNNATVGGTLGVTGATTLSSTLDVTGNTAVGGTLGVTNAATFSSTIGVTGAATFGDTLSVSGAATLSSTLAVTSNTTIGGTLNVSGASTLDSVGVTNNATVGGTLGVTGATTLSSTLAVTGSTTLSDTLSVAGATTLNSVGITNNATIGGTLDVTGTTTLTILTATTSATLNSLGVTNNATVGGTLGVTGATMLSTLSTTGAATLNSVGVTNNATVGGTLNVTGATTLGNTLSVANDLSVSTTVSIDAASGNAGFDGTVTAAYFVGDGSQLTNLQIPGSLAFKGSIDCTTASAPAAVSGDFYLNTGTGTVKDAVGWTGIATSPIAEGDFVYFDGTNWSIGGGNDSGFVTLSTAQTITGAKAFSAQIAASAGITSSADIASTTLTLSGKATSASTVGGDGDTTLTTKDYVDASSAAAGMWLENSGKLYPKTLTNKVGIGTDSPNSMLTVDGTATITGNVALNTTTSDATTVNGRLQVTPGSFAAPGIRNSSNGNTGFVVGDFLGFSTAGSERMRVLADGKIGIGTDSPGSKLDVAGLTTLRGPDVDVLGETLRFARGDNPAIRYHSIYAKHGGAVANNLLSFRLHDAVGSNTQQEVMVLKGNGNVGIGTDAPAEKLHVAGNVALTGNVLPATDGGSALGSTTKRFSNVYTQDMHFSNEGTEGNSIDGTTGNWTLQEGHDHLYFINNKTGMKFRVVMEEV